MMSL
jgi:hypothetical protein